MKTLLACPVILLLLVSQPAPAADAVAPRDLRRAVPNDVFMVVYGKHNPERDFQKQYYQDVWQTVRETKILDRAVQIMTSRMSEQDLNQAQGVLQELREATESIDVAALADCQEVIYAQRMQLPTSHHLFLMRVTPEAAEGTARGVKNLFDMAAKYAPELSVDTKKIGDAEATTLWLPAQVPFQPTMIRLNDVVLLSTSSAMAEQSLKMLTSGTGDCKFDDPRLVAALQRLPEAEDAVVFYDGRTQAENMRAFGPFIRQAAGNSPEVGRVAELVDLVVNDLLTIDYVVTVEYTEGNLNRSASCGKWLDGCEDTVLWKMLAVGQPFEQWQDWVPANAVAYSLGTGVNLHPLYERVMAVLQEHVPESHEALEQFAQVQEQLGVHLDRDILQAFSGEYVLVTLPCPQVSPMAPVTGSVLALRCQKPDRIRELLHRGFDLLAEHPVIKAQQIKLAPVEQLDGLETISAPMLAGFGVQPILGFRDGWFILGTNLDTVQQVLKTRAGEGDSILETEAFQKLKLEVQGPVYSISYTDTAAQTRQMAKTVGQLGIFVSMGLGMAGAQANSEELKPIQEMLALLPDLSRIIAKFDFLEAKIAVAQAGDEPGSFRQQSVQVVRPPADK